MQNQEDSTENKAVASDDSDEHSVLNGRIPTDDISNSLPSRLGYSPICEPSVSNSCDFNFFHQSNNNLSSIQLKNTMSSINSTLARSEIDWKNSLLASQLRNNQHFVQDLPSIGEDTIVSGLSIKKRTFRRNSLPLSSHSMKRKLSSDSEVPLLSDIIDEQSLSNSSCDPLVAENSEGVIKEPPAWTSCYSPYRKRTTSVVSSERGIDSLINKLFNDDQRQRFLALKKKNKEKMEAKERSKGKSVDLSYKLPIASIESLSLVNLSKGKNILGQSRMSSENVDLDTLTNVTDSQDLIFKSKDLSKETDFTNDSLADESNERAIEELPAWTIPSNSHTVVPDMCHQQNVAQLCSSFSFITEKNLSFPTDANLVDPIKNHPIINTLTESSNKRFKASLKSQTAIQETSYQHSLVSLESNASFQAEVELIPKTSSVNNSIVHDELEDFSSASDIVRSVDMESDTKTPTLNYSSSQTSNNLENVSPLPSTFNISHNTCYALKEKLSDEFDLAIDQSKPEIVSNTLTVSRNTATIFEDSTEKAVSDSGKNLDNCVISQDRTDVLFKESEIINSDLQTKNKENVSCIFQKCQSDGFDFLTNQFEIIETVNSSIPSSQNTATIVADSIEKVDVSDSEKILDSCTIVQDNENVLFKGNKVTNLDSQTEYEEKASRLIKESQSSEFDFVTNQSESIEIVNNTIPISQNRETIIEDSIDKMDVSGSEKISNSCAVEQDKEDVLFKTSEVISIDPQSEYSKNVSSFLKESQSDEFDFVNKESEFKEIINNTIPISHNTETMLEDSIQKMDVSGPEKILGSCTIVQDKEYVLFNANEVNTDLQSKCGESVSSFLKEDQSGEFDFVTNQSESIDMINNTIQISLNTETNLEDSLEKIGVGNSEKILESCSNTQDREDVLFNTSEVINIDSQTEYQENVLNTDNEELIQMPVIYLENEGDLIFVDENGVILDSELVNSLLNISVDQLKTQIIQSTSENQGEVITIQTDNAYESVLSGTSLSCVSACESENTKLTAVPLNNPNDLETALTLEGEEYRKPIVIDSKKDNISICMPIVDVENNGEHVTSLSTDYVNRNKVLNLPLETDGNAQNSAQYSENATASSIVTLNQSNALDVLMQSIIGNQDDNYTENLNFQQDPCEEFLSDLSNEKQLIVKSVQPDLQMKTILSSSATNLNCDSNSKASLCPPHDITKTLETDSIAETKEQSNLSFDSRISSIDNTISETSTTLDSQALNNKISSPLSYLETEDSLELRTPFPETVVSIRKSTARKSGPIHRQTSIDSNSNGYNSSESCDRHNHTDSSSLDDRPSSKRRKTSECLVKEIQTANDTLVASQVKTKCTALKTFVKPFTVAKKSVTEKTAFNSVIQSYFGVRTAKKTCKTNQELQNTDSPDEVSILNGSWSPLRELRFKSACHCSTEEVPCLCNGEELQLVCEAEDTIDGTTIPCAKSVSHQYLLTPSSEIRHRAFCDVHMHRLRKHHCCPKCGIFCTQGAFSLCSYASPLRGGEQSHFFHPNCFLIPDVGLPPSCPHCCKFSDFNHVQLSLFENTKPEDISQTLCRMNGENLTSFLENYSVLMTKVDKEHQSKADVTVAPRNQELKKMIMAVTKDKVLRLRPTGKCLFNPIKTGDVKKVLQLIGNGVNPNHKFDFHKNDTPLHIAAFYGLTGIVHVLLQYGAHIDAVNEDLETPLFLAVEKNQLPVVRYLVFAGAQLDVKNENGLTAFHVASKHNAKEIARLFYNFGNIDINIQDDGGWTPLVWACENNNVDLVKWLLELGADPNVRDNEENTALHWAACSGDSEALELLLQNECNINFVNERGDSALHIAARKDNFVGVRLLLARDAATDCKNKDGETPLMCCDPGSKSLRILKRHMKECSKYANVSLQPHVVYRDISRGAEVYPIQAVNEVDQQEFIMEFRYITRNCYAPSISIVATVDSMKVCHCKDNCYSHDCACTRISRCWYDMDGQLVSDFNLIAPPSIYECNKTCHCPKTCINRVVQKGLRHPLQLFRTHNRGWGIKTLKSLPKGTFVCEYIGEIVTEREIDEREDDSYLFDLESKDGDFCLDGKLYGNAARFINHSCDPNLISIRTFVEHQDQNFPRIAFFTMKDIQAFEELCFDYGTEFWIAKCETILCTCNSSLCKYSKDSIDDTLLAYETERQRMEQNKTVVCESSSKSILV